MRNPREHRAFGPLGLVGLLLAVPGSPSLALDGLPFGERLEVVSLACILLVATGSRLRGLLGTALHTRTRRGFFVLLLLTLTFVKLLTFARFPLGDHFEVCLKGSYRPVSETCEKSFDNLFHSNDGVNAQGDLTRVDSVIDFRTTTGDPNSLFGASHSTWNLPFQNDYPRFSELWQNRLPFTARIGGVFTVPTNAVLPIEFVGSLKVKTSTMQTADAEYQARKLTLLPVVAGRQEVVIDFEYTDTDSSVVPETAPPPRGPYAHLVVGDPFTLDDPANIAVHLRGFVADIEGADELRNVEIRSDSETVVAVIESRPDVAEVFGSRRYLNSGFYAAVPVDGSLDTQTELRVVAIMRSGTSHDLGRIVMSTVSTGAIEPQFIGTSDDSVVSDLRAWYAFDKPPTLLRAEHRIVPSVVSSVALAIVDLSQLALTVGLLLSALFMTRRDRRRDIVPLIRAVALTFGAVWLVTRHPGTPVIDLLPMTFWVAAISMIVVAHSVLRRDRPSGPVISTVAIAASFVLVTETVHRYTGIGRGNWWGMTIFRERDMDWYLFQGYAYRIFVEQSLRAGENLFYFMPGARYVIFLTHIVFGNNDTLIAIVVYAALLAATIVAARSALLATEGDTTARLMVFIGFFSVVTMTIEPLSVQLAVSSSSETFAWTALFGMVPLLLSSASLGARGAALLGLTAGTVTFLRPNYLLVSVLVVLIICIIIATRDDRPRPDRLLVACWLLFGFVASVSLALLHNMYYAETVNFFTNRTDPNQTVFEPLRFFDYFVDQSIRKEVHHKFAQFFYWREPSSDTFQLASWFGQMLYVLAIARMIRRRRLVALELTALLLPVLYILSATPFGIMTIPERQFNVATYSTIISAAVIVGSQARQLRATSSPPAESPST